MFAYECKKYDRTVLIDENSIRTTIEEALEESKKDKDNKIISEIFECTDRFEGFKKLWNDGVNIFSGCDKKEIEAGKKYYGIN